MNELVNEGSNDYAHRVASNRDETGRRTIRARGQRRVVFRGEEAAWEVLDGTALGGFLRLARGRGSRLEHAETGNLLNNGPILGAERSS